MKDSAITKDVATFKKLWEESYEQQYKAACLFYKYADNVSDKNKFMEVYPTWSIQWWRTLYYVGAGALSKEVLRVHPYCIGVHMLKHNISLIDQEKILTKGLTIVTSKTEMATIKPKQLRAKHIEQCFNTDGTKKNVTDQLIWLAIRDTQKIKLSIDKLERINKSTWRARTACEINKKVLAKLLTIKPYILTKTDLEKIIKEISE